MALSKSAIIISPDYRLMPEANGLDILQDVKDFYDWLQTPDNLDKCLPKGVTAANDRVLVTGESAGGWLALQSALRPTPRQQIRAVISQYAMIDMRSEYYTGDFEKHIFTPVAPQLPRSILRDYLAGLKGSEVIASAVPPDRVPLVISSLQQGSFGKLLGEDSSLYPLEMIDSVERLPPLWLIHGTDDTVIPAAGSYDFERKLLETLPVTEIHVSFEAGDHGFDNDPSVNLETPWVKQGLEFVAQFWP